MDENNTTNDKHSIPLFEIFSTKPRENGNGFGWITLETAKSPHIKTMNMQTRRFCERRFACHLPGTWSKIQLEDHLDQKARQTTSLQAASYIAYECSHALGPDSEHPQAVQVEVIVPSKQRRRFRRGTLLRWLGESVHPEVEHLEAEPIHPGRIKPFTSHEPSSNSTPRRRGRSPPMAKA